MTDPPPLAPGSRSQTILALLWLALGLSGVTVVAWLGWTASAQLLNGSPWSLLLVGLTLLVALVAVAWSLATLVTLARRGNRSDVGPRQLLLRARGRIAVAVPLLLIFALAQAILVYVRPLAATASATAALRTSDSVRMADRLTWYELEPTRRDRRHKPVVPTTGLVFAPGARVDARAYAAVLRPLAERGVLVCVLKEPLGLAVVEPGQASRPIANHPEIRTWAVGGHSLGGAVIAGFAQDHRQVSGLVLYGSYPSGKVDRPGLRVLSVAGSNDRLVTADDLAAARADLPADTTYVTVEGAVHACFGDYGHQPGDGIPAVDRAVAQQQIVAATADFLTALRPR